MEYSSRRKAYWTKKGEEQVIVGGVLKSRKVEKDELREWWIQAMLGRKGLCLIWCSSSNVLSF